MLRNPDLNKKLTLNVGGFICLMFTVYLVYDLVLKDTQFPLSVSALLVFGSHLSRIWHLLTIGLIPIYLALIIFGIGLASLYFGSMMQNWITRLLR